MSKDATEKLFAYISLLEETNELLEKSLEACIELLTQFNSLVPDPEKWQEMLDLFNKTLRTGQRIIEKKTLH